MVKKLFAISSQRGFTLIELLIVVAILGILAGAVVPNLASARTTATVGAATTELENVETAATAYYANTTSWPHDSNDLTNLVGTPKATYIFDPATGFAIGATNVSWQGITWSAPIQPYTASGKWIRK